MRVLSFSSDIFQWFEGFFGLTLGVGPNWGVEVWMGGVEKIIQIV